MGLGPNTEARAETEGPPVKRSTRGALHCAESANWLAWQYATALSRDPLGTLMESALGHWSLKQLDAFARWYRELPRAEEIAR